jgi:hypothetical protein
MCSNLVWCCVVDVIMKDLTLASIVDVIMKDLTLASKLRRVGGAIRALYAMASLIKRGASRRIDCVVCY